MDRAEQFGVGDQEAKHRRARSLGAGLARRQEQEQPQPDVEYRHTRILGKGLNMDRESLVRNLELQLGGARPVTVGPLRGVRFGREGEAQGQGSLSRQQSIPDTFAFLHADPVEQEVGQGASRYLDIVREVKNTRNADMIGQGRIVTNHFILFQASKISLPD